MGTEKKINRRLYAPLNEFEMELFWIKAEDVPKEEARVSERTIDLDLIKKVAEKKGEEVKDSSFEAQRTASMIRARIKFLSEMSKSELRYFEIKNELTSTNKLIERERNSIIDSLGYIKEMEEEVIELKEEMQSYEGKDFTIYNGVKIPLENIDYL